MLVDVAAPFGMAFAGWEGAPLNGLPAVVEMNGDREAAAVFRSLYGTPDLALNARVTGSDSMEAGAWSLSNLVDGRTYSKDPSMGYTSGSVIYNPDLQDRPIWLELDLGKDQLIDSVVLWPRDDQPIRHFPVDFSIEVRGDGEEAYRTAAQRSDQDDAPAEPVTVSFDKTRARFVRLVVTKLSPHANPGDCLHLQLAEMEVRLSGGAPNLAAHKTVTAESLFETGAWSASYLTDGRTASRDPAIGYTSGRDVGQNPDVSGNPMWLDVDLGSNQTFNQVVLWPRMEGGPLNFPDEFTLMAKGDGEDAYIPILRRTGQSDTLGGPLSLYFPETTGRYLRLLVTRLSARPSPGDHCRLQLAEIQVFHTDYVRPAATDTVTISGASTVTVGEEIRLQTASGPDHADNGAATALVVEANGLPSDKGVLTKEESGYRLEARHTGTARVMVRADDGFGAVAFHTITITEADKRELSALVEKARIAWDEREKYTASSTAGIPQALQSAAGVLENKDAFQKQVDKTAEDLRQRLAGLTPRPPESTNSTVTGNPTESTGSTTGIDGTTGTARSTETAKPAEDSQTNGSIAWETLPDKEIPAGSSAPTGVAAAVWPWVLAAAGWLTLQILRPAGRKNRKE